MPFVSVTRLRLRSIRFLPAFAWHTERSRRQLRATPGFLRGAISADLRSRTFWTTTIWSDEGSMRGYRNSGAHMKAMPHLLDWCDEASVAHWTQEDAGLPSPEKVLRALLETGRLSKVRHPSVNHSAGQLVADGRPPVARPLIVNPVAELRGG